MLRENNGKMLDEILKRLEDIAYLQGYKFVFEKSDSCEMEYDSFKLMPTDKTLRKAENICRILPEDLSGKRVLDIGCNKGFFSFECLRRGANKVVGIDVLPEIIGVLQQIVPCSRLFKGLKFYKMQFGRELASFGKFDLILFLSCYHYVYGDLKSHNKIFSILSSLCVERVILELPLELDDNFARKFLKTKCQGESLAGYNYHTILHAASRYFGSVRYMANSGFLRTRDIFILEEPATCGSEYLCEWKDKDNVWGRFNLWAK